MSDAKLCQVYDCRFPKSHVTKGHLCGSCFKYGHGICECPNELNKNKLVNFYKDQMPDNNHCTFGGCKYKNLHSTESHHCEGCNGRLHSKNTCPSVINDKLIDIKCPVCKKNNLVNKNQHTVYGISDTCVVCMCNSANIFFINCRHVCVCTDCIKILQNDNAADGYKIPYDESYLLEKKYNLNDIKKKLKDYPSYLNVYTGMGTSACIRRLNKNSQLECLFVSPDDIYDQTKMKINNEFIEGYAYTNDFMIHEY